MSDHGKTIYSAEETAEEGAREWPALDSAQPGQEVAAADPVDATGKSPIPPWSHLCQLTHLYHAVSNPSSSPAAPKSRPPSPLRRSASPRHSLRAAYLDQGAHSSAPPSTLPPTPLPDHPAFRPVSSIYPSLSPNSLAGTPSRPRPSAAPSSWSAADSPGAGIRAVPTPRRGMPGGLFGVESEAEDGMEVEVMGLAGADGTERAATPPPEVAVAAVASPPAFVFGSPNAATAAFTFGSAFAAVAPPSDSAKPLEVSTSTLTTAQSIAAQLKARILASRVAAGGPVDRPLVPVTFTATLGKGKAAAKSVGEKEEQFDGAHKRAFDKMDSIADHYAARRSPAKGKRAAEDEAQAAQPEAAEEERAGKRPKTVSSASSKGTLAGAPRGSGGASGPPEPKALSARAKGEAALARSEAVLDGARAREQAVRRRQLELAKARRRSGAAGLASARKERRRSVQVGPVPKAGNVASRFLAGAFKKMVGKAEGAPVLAGTKSAGAPDSSSTKPAPRLPSSKSTFALPTATSQAKARAGSAAPPQAGPSHTTRPPKPAPATARTTATGRPLAGSPVRKAPVTSTSTKLKFDLEASLARPLSYVPKVDTGSLVRSGSTLRLSTTTAGGSPNSVRRASTLSLAGRVGNVGLMRAVRAQGGAQLAEVDVLPDDEETPAPGVALGAGGAAMRREEEVLPRMSGSFPNFTLAAAPAAKTNALSAAPEALLTVKSAFCFGPGSTSAASAALSLGSPIHTLASPRPVLGAHNFLPPSSPGLGADAAGTAGGALDLTERPLKPAPTLNTAAVVRKKAAGTPGKAPVGRKVVSGASRGARDLKARQAVGKAGEGLESRVRKVAVAKAGAGAGGKGSRVGEAVV